MVGTLSALLMFSTVVLPAGRAISCLPLVTVSSFSCRASAIAGGGAELSRSALVSLRSAFADSFVHTFSPSFRKQVRCNDGGFPLVKHNYLARLVGHHAKPLSHTVNVTYVTPTTHPLPILAVRRRRSISRRSRPSLSLLLFLPPPSPSLSSFLPLIYFYFFLPFRPS